MSGVPNQISRSCTEAALGYAAAATAVYTELACRALDFWGVALSGLVEEPVEEEAKAVTKRPEVSTEPKFGMSADDWNPLSWFEPRRFEALWKMDATTTPVSAMFTMANAVPLRGPSTSWGMAKVMIDSGVPRSIAWPTAEANAAALDAADAASNGFRKIVASFHTQSGYATSARSMTPSAIVAGLMIGIANGPLPLSW
jgi:hypothetical protein